MTIAVIADRFPYDRRSQDLFSDAPCDRYDRMETWLKALAKRTRKSTQVLDLRSTCVSFGHRLAATCVDFGRAQIWTQVVDASFFCRLATQRKSTQVDRK